MANKYAILIGINGYHESLGRLKYCVNDVRRLADVLTQGEDAFPKDRLLVLTDDGERDKCPTYANIHSWLASYLAQAEDDDTVFVYFAGHGREHGGKAYLLPSDATLQTVHVTGIPVSYVQELLERCKARQKVLVLDACHSGAGRDVAAMSTGMLNELSGGKGIYTITSCDAEELSHEWADKKHGVFSHFLSEGLAGGCPPDAQNRVTAEALYEWVYDHVRNWARNHRCTQTPKRFSSGSGAVVLHSIGTGDIPVRHPDEASSFPLDGQATNGKRDGSIFRAAARGDVSTLQEYLERGGDPHVLNDKGSGLVRIAVGHGQCETLNVLMSHGLGIDQCQVDGGSHLWLASYQGHTDMVQLLLDKGLDATHTNSIGDTPLHVAARNGKVDVCRLLLSRGCDINAQNHDGYTPLHWASGSGHSAVVEFLLENGARTEIRTVDDGCQPLHLACLFDHELIVRILVEAGADVNALDASGLTALYAGKSTSIQEFLKSHGAREFSFIRKFTFVCGYCRRKLSSLWRS